MGKVNNDSYQTMFSSMLTQVRAGVSANAPLAMVKASLVIPGQPIQVTLRAQQSAVKKNQPPLNMFATINKLYAQGGMRALTRGIVPSGIKEGGRYLTYKSTLIKNAPSIIDYAWPNNSNSLPVTIYSPLKVLLTGTFAAVCDTTCGGGIEAYATYRATSQGKHAQANFAAELRKIPSIIGKLRRVYQGAVPATLKETAAYTTFFAASGPINRTVRDFYGVEGIAPWYVTATSAVSTGALVAVTSSPLDIAKTLAQMPDATEKGVISVIKENVQRHGVRGLTAGVGTKSILIVVGWSVNYLFTQSGLAKDEIKQDLPTLKV